MSIEHGSLSILTTEHGIEADQHPQSYAFHDAAPIVRAPSTIVIKRAAYRHVSECCATVVLNVLGLPFIYISHALQQLPQALYGRERNTPQANYGPWGCSLASAIVRDFTYNPDHGEEAFPGEEFAQKIFFVFQVREQPCPLQHRSLTSPKV